MSFQYTCLVRVFFSKYSTNVTKKEALQVRKEEKYERCQGLSLLSYTTM